MVEPIRQSVMCQLLVTSFILLLLAGSADAGFQRSYLTVTVTIAPDGSADVREELRFYMDTPDSVDLYKVSLKAANNLAGWRSRINLQDVRYHVDTSVVQIADTRLQPLSPDTCDYYRNTCYGTFVVEYKVAPPVEGKGIVSIDRYAKPRVIDYTFNRGALLFETSLAGEPYLPDLTTLEIRIPQGSKVTALSPRSAEYADLGSIPADATKFTWHGRLLLSGMELKFERKESLLDEVTGFFTALQETLGAWLTSREGMALMAVAIIFVIGYAALQRRKEE